MDPHQAGRAPCAAVLLTLVLSACGTPMPTFNLPGPLPAPAGTAAAAASAPSTADVALARFVHDHRQAAVRAAAANHWADAAWSAEVVLAVAPGDIEARSIRELAQSASLALLNDVLPRARQARERGELDLAMRLYLEVLGAVPHHTGAADALRDIERVRSQRGSQLARQTVPPRSAADASERNDVEHAMLLAQQGEVEAAIALLQPLAAAQRDNTALRNALAELHFRHAESQAAANRPAAVAALERSLQWQPGHRLAAARLKEWRVAPLAPAPSRR